MAGNRCGVHGTLWTVFANVLLTHAKVETFIF